MMEFDLELKKICEKYGLSVNETRERYNDFLDAFQEIWEQIPDNEPIAFYGFSEAFYHMHNRVRSNPKNVICIIENHAYHDINYDDNANKPPVIKINQINEYKFHKVILTGFAPRHQMKRDIIDYDANIEVIDIYEILEKKGLHYDIPFISTKIDWFYINLETVRMAYEKSSNPEGRQKNLKKLIQAYLECRDFVYADLYIQEYINNRYSDWDSFVELKDELGQFTASIKENIKSRGNKNVFVFVFDSFSFDLSQSAPFIKKLAQNSLSFSNAFSPGLYSRSSTFSYITGKDYVESGFYKTVFLEREDSDFLFEMKASGYKIKHISSYYFTFLLKINDYDSSKIYGGIQPLLYWSLLTDIADESANCIYFVHNMELHPPYYSGYATKAFTPYPTQRGIDTQQQREYWQCFRKDALKYVDKQFEFYTGLLNLDKDAVIITSDHQDHLARSSDPASPITLDMSKISLIIHSKSVKAGIYEDIYSTINMPNLLRQLIGGDEKMVITPMDYVRQEVEPYYLKNLTRELFSTYWYGSATFITNVEKYIFYFDGSEEYFFLSDLEKNLIENEQYRERIDYFRSQINIDTREVWKYMFEKHPHLLEIHKGRVEEFLYEDKNPNKLRSQSN